MLAITRTRSLKPSLKQFCICDLACGIIVICILQKLWSVQIFVVILLSNKFTEVIEDLYRLGFIGNYLPVSQTYRWQHKGDDHVILSDEWRLMIHHALQNALSVGKKQDFGLKRNDPPQIGDVVEVTVYNIINSFAFVKFTKGNKKYDGAIHISQFANIYINKLSEYIDYGDTFLAVITAYDDRHQNWQLSKKNVVINETDETK